VTTVRLALKAGVPLNRPVLKISRFSSSNGFAEPSQVKLGQLRIGFHLLDVAGGQVDL
jgi:hypothetical protein